VTQNFSQKLDINYKKTYSPIINTITLRYLINLSAYHKLHIYLINIITTYLYDSLNQNIYIKIPEKLNISKPSNKYSPKLYSVKLL
ncbi:hypothetical protein DF186_19410, partial [Enterococcus hirae]